ncbi:toll-like receptor 6 [Lutzomyia longipalpis]|uniref:toll-like receptor 6 n=1 Tax=Lutzomyia longipalpis TaxID=7200 RepID=UPI00248404BC|nr:toll-like receptor 6 [Lutzomyia longipalpis]
MIFLSAILFLQFFIAESFSGAPKREILKCDDSNETGVRLAIHEEIINVLCVLTSREFTQNVEYSFQLKKNEFIVYLEIYNSSMTTIPDSLLPHLQFVREIIVQNTSLKHVDRLNYKFEYLFLMSIGDNAIESLDDNAFTTFEDLIILNLSKNKLTHLKGNPFPTFNTDLFYDLSHNKIKNITESVFKGMDFGYLALTNNSLENADRIFEYVVRAENLNLSHNKLKKFQPIGSLNTSFIDLSSNFLESVDFTKIDASTINMLKVNDNSLTKISLGSSIKSLTSLQLEKNKLGNNLQDICKCEQLVNLTLKDNLIRDIGSCFSEMKALKLLDLAKNRIKAIKPESFHKDNAIETLDLAFNRIESFNEDTMTVFGHLKILNLTGNRLKDFYDNPKTIMPNLMVLGLSHNKFKCSRFSALQGKFSLLFKFFIDRSVSVDGTNVSKEGCYDDKEETPKTTSEIFDAIIAMQTCLSEIKDELKKTNEILENKVENLCSNSNRENH